MALKCAVPTAHRDLRQRRVGREHANGSNAMSTGNENIPFFDGAIAECGLGGANRVANISGIGDEGSEGRHKW